MDYLLDTHTLIWYAEGDTKLPERIREIILDRNNSIFISYASIWEMSIKISIGKLKVKFSLQEWGALLQAEGVLSIPLGLKHFEQLLALPFHHNDPFDRLLIAQAISENLTIITHDSRFSSYPVQLEAF